MIYDKVKPVTAVDMVMRLNVAVETEEYNDEEMVNLLVHLLECYKLQTEQEVIEVAFPTREQADDAMLNKIGQDYDLTLNQVVGFMELTEKMNRESLADTGVCAVPFWFHLQHAKTLEINKSLIQETENLMATLKAIQKSSAGELQTRVDAMILPERSSIITGVQTPYVPGETGPRIGDESLDKDNAYLPSYEEAHKVMSKRSI